MTLEEILRNNILFYSTSSEKETKQAILSWVKEQLPKERESPKGKDCKCFARYDGDCGCGADWTDSDGYNQCLQDILNKLEKEK